MASFPADFRVTHESQSVQSDSVSTAGIHMPNSRTFKEHFNFAESVVWKGGKTPLLFSSHFMS